MSQYESKYEPNPNGPSNGHHPGYDPRMEPGMNGGYGPGPSGGPNGGHVPDSAWGHPSPMAPTPMVPGWNGPTPFPGLSPASFLSVTAPCPPHFVSEPPPTDPSSIRVTNGVHAPNGHSTLHSGGHSRPATERRTTNGIAHTAGHGNGTPPTEARLVDLVVRAESSIDELERLAATALDATAASAQAATDLQERLRLGVRMLQAFDVQIQRCEQVGSQSNAQLQQQMHGQLQAQGVQMTAQFANQMSAIAQQCDMRVRGLVETLEQRMNETVPFLDERIRQAHESVTMHVGRIVDERIAGAERAIDERYGPVRDDLRRYADDLVASFAKRLDTVLEQGVNERIAAVLESAIESRLGKLQPVGPAAQALSETVAQMSELDERMHGRLRDAEMRVNALDLALRNADQRLNTLLRQAEETTDALLGTVGTASTLKDLIADEARVSRRLADEAHATSREHQREIQDLLERAAIAKSSLDQQLQLIREMGAEADGRLDSARAMRGEIEATIQRMAPIESALRSDSAPLQHVVESISSNVRQTLAEDMRSFSTALRGLAARAEHAFMPTRFDPARFDEFSPMPDPMSTPAPFPLEPTEVFSGSDPMRATDMHGMTGMTSMHGMHGNPSTDVHAGSMSTLPVDTRRLTAEVMALDATTLLRGPQQTTQR